MANYATLKAALQTAIKQNGNNEITGNLLQQALLSMIDSLGAGYQYAGFATPETDPGTPDQHLFYFASAAGVYSNFGDIILDGKDVAILKYNGTWIKDLIGVASTEYVGILESVVMDFVDNMFTDEIVDVDSYTLVGNSYMDISARKILPTTVNSFLYYYPLQRGKIYRFTSAINWNDGYAAIGFNTTVPQIDEKYNLTILPSNQPGSIVFIAPSNGYAILLKRLNDIVTIQENKVDLAEIQQFVETAGTRLDNLENNVTEIQQQLTVFDKISESSLVSIGGAYLDDRKRILETQYAIVYYYPVVRGKLYQVSSELAWGAFTSVGFGVSLPVIGGTFDTIIVTSEAPTTEPVNFVPQTDGYILLMYHSTQKSYVYAGRPVDLQALTSIVSPLNGKTIAILGDSIMQFMGGDVPANTVTLRNYNDPTDPTVYQTSQATVISGIMYLTSSLTDGQPTENSIRLEIVNSAQNDMDHRGWDFIKQKLGAFDVINCGQGGGRFGEMGIITAYPSVTANDELVNGKLQGLPNQVRMLKRLVSDGIRPEPNVIVIWMGVNGTTNYTTDTLEQAMAINWDVLADDALGYQYRTKFFGAIRYAIESLYRAFPDALIMFVSPVMTNRGNLQIDNDDPAYRGYDNLKEVAADIKEIAERFACMFFDALTTIGIANFAYRADTVTSGGNQIATGTALGNLIPRYSPANDGIHPNAAGKIVWGNYLCKVLNSFYFDKAE